MHTKILFAWALLGAAAATASGEPDRGFVLETRTDAPRETNIWVQRVVHDGRTIEVRGHDGSIEVLVDGVRVGPDRYNRTNDGRVIVLDEHGEQLHEFRTRESVPARVAVRLAEPRPAVMLGINPQNAPASLRDHLGLEFDAIVVERVIEGLSADKSGIRENDVIVSIDGSEGVSQASLREILGGFEPGDVALIKLIRGGKAMTLPVTLQAYDAERLGIAPETPRPPDFQLRGEDRASIGQRGRALRARAHERVMNALSELGIEEDERDAIDRIMRETLKDLEEGVRALYSPGAQRLSRSEALGEEHRALVEMRRKAQEAVRNMERQMLELRDGRLFLQEQSDEIEEEIEKRRRLEREGAGRMEALEERLEGLEERLEEFVDEIAERLEEITDRVMDKIEELGKD